MADPMRVFISHGWDSDHVRTVISKLLDDALPGWEDVSIPKERTVALARGAQEAARRQIELLQERCRKHESDLEHARATRDEVIRRHEAKVDRLTGQLGECQEAEKVVVQEVEKADRAVRDYTSLSETYGQDLSWVRGEMARLDRALGLRGNPGAELLRSWNQESESRGSEETQKKLWEAKDKLQEADKRLREAQTRTAEAARALKGATDGLGRAREAVSELGSNLRNAREEIKRKQVVIESLRPAQINPAAALDVRRLLPSWGKLSLPWLTGVDWVTATLALEIYERVRQCDLVVLALIEGFEWRVWLDFEFRAAADARIPVIAVGSSYISPSVAYYATQTPLDPESFNRAVAQLLSEERKLWSRFDLDEDRTRPLGDRGPWNIREWADAVRAELDRGGS